MSELNAGAAKAMLELGNAVHAATDVTGFGLLGHLRSMMEASGKSARVSAGDVPIIEGVSDLIERDSVPGGTKSNLAHVNEVTAWSDSVSDVGRLALSDAQTSGGLLIAVEPSKASDLIKLLQQQETPVAAQIGEVVEKGKAVIEVID